MTKKFLTYYLVTRAWSVVIFLHFLSPNFTLTQYIVPNRATLHISVLAPRNLPMSMDPSNPYASPQFPSVPPPLKPMGGPVAMDYMRMVTYVFENPNWFMNCLMCGLCALIPVIGGIVAQGYSFEVVVGLIQAGGGRYPDFDFNRFGDYLMRGLWPFLAGLVATLGIMLVMGVLFGIIAALGRVAGKDAGEAIAGLSSLLLTILSPLIMLFVQPMLLRAALTMDFGQAFQFEWAKDFVQKMWLEMLIGFLLWYVAAMVLSMVGVIACCIGLLVTGPIAILAQSHLMFQLYSVYVSRGGMPIAIKLTGQPAMMAPM